MDRKNFKSQESLEVVSNLKFKKKHLCVSGRREEKSYLDPKKIQSPVRVYLLKQMYEELSLIRISA